MCWPAGLRHHRPAWLRALTAVTILTVVLWRVGTGPFLAGLAHVDLWSLAAASGIAVVTTLCCAWRWTLVARAMGVDVPLRGALGACYRSQFVNVATPGGILGDVDRAVRHGRTVGDTGVALRSVVGERLAGQLVLVAMAGSALCLLPSPVRPTARLAAAVLVGGAVAAGLLLMGVRSRVRPAWARWLGQGGGGVRAGALARHTWPGILLASAVAVCGHVLTFIVAARTAGSGAPALQLLPWALIVLVAAGLPNLAGWGPREGVAAWAFGAGGWGAEQGVATAVVYGVMVFVATLPGAVLLVTAGIRRATRAPRVGQGRSTPARAPAAGGTPHE